MKGNREKTRYELTISDYKEVIEDYRRLTKELSVCLNGKDSAISPSLCDIVAQVKNDKLKIIKKQLYEELIGYQKYIIALRFYEKKITEAKDEKEYKEAKDNLGQIIENILDKEPVDENKH